MNLTDGLDGLASGAAIMVLAAYVIIGDLQYRNDCTTALSFGCSDVRDPLDAAVVAAAVAGACFGFLWWNAPPAKTFMGDTGSLPSAARWPAWRSSPEPSCCCCSYSAGCS
jgi:phospho-N-acetylmuramoyl-pentapeptide-transferase